MVSPKAFRAEDLEVADVRFIDYYARLRFRGWSPDGKYVLVQTNKVDYLLIRMGEVEVGGASYPQGVWSEIGDLWFMSVDGAERHKVTELIGSATWSPDGQYIAYTTPANDEGTEGTVYVADIKTLKAWKIADCDFIPWISVFWLPSNELTFVRDGHIFAIQLDGSGVRKLNNISLAPPKSSSPPGQYQISPNGQKIAWIPGDKLEQIWVADLDGTDATLVTDKRYPSFDLAWSPNSKYLVFPILNGHGPLGGDLWIVSADGSESRPVAITEREDESLMEPTWSPDSQVIVFTRGASPLDNSLWEVNLDGTGLRRLGGDQVSNLSHPRWSPTGSQIGYSQEYWEPSGRPNAAVITLQSKQ